MKRCTAVLGFLLCCAWPSSAQKGQAPIVLNHVFTVLDSATYSAMTEDPFLRKQFAPSTVNTTQRTDMTYTGLYFFGEHTYIELFDAANSPVGELGNSGIALGVERQGALAAIQASSNGALTDPTAVTKPYEGRQIPWFTETRPAEEKTGGWLSVWLMEYAPEYLQEWNPPKEGAAAPTVDITRASTLTRLRSTLPAVVEPVFHDVFEITLAVDNPGAAEFVQLAKRLALKRDISRKRITLQGADFTLVLVPATATVHGVREIRMHAATQNTPSDDRKIGSVRIHRSRDEVDWIWE